MTKEQKIQLADLIINFLSSTTTEEKSDMPKLIGTLNKEFAAYVGLKAAKVGTPVFQYRDRYIVYFESETGRTVEMAYYQDTLKPFIDAL